MSEREQPSYSELRSNELTPVHKNKTVLKLGWVSFLADVSSEMLYPITPVFLSAVLGASMASIGVIEGVAEAVSSVLKVYSGVWSDRIKRRVPFIFLGYLLSTLAKPFTGIATVWTDVLFARSLDRVGKGLRTSPRDALLADSVHTRNRGAAFGFHRFMDTLGAAIGPLIAFAFLYESHSEDLLRSFYFWALIPGGMATLLVLLIRESRKNGSQGILEELSSGDVKANGIQSAATSPLKREYISRLFEHDSKGMKQFLFAWVLFSLVNTGDVFLILKAKAQGASFGVAILMYCFYNLVYALFSPYFGRWSDTWGRKKVLEVSLVFFVLAYLGFAWIDQSQIYWVLFGVYGLFMASSEGVSKALIIDFVPEDLKATGSGLLAMLTGFSAIFAGLVGGLLWDHFSPSAPFFLGAIGAFLALVVLRFKNAEC